MKVPILSINSEELKKIELPLQFDEPVNEDIIHRAVLAVQSARRQPYGSFPEAGKRASAKLYRQRRGYKGAYGLGISRVPRKTMSRRGTRFSWIGAFAPGTVGGIRAHHPKAEKMWAKKINKKENNKAIRSAIAATASTELVAAHGHITPKIYPFIIETKIEELSKTSEAMSVLEKLGLAAELARSKIRKIRAGKGKLRGRHYQKKPGPLLVVSKSCGLEKSARNIQGVKVVRVEMLDAVMLAPGARPARLTLFTEAAIKRLAEEKLFV